MYADMGLIMKINYKLFNKILIPFLNSYCKMVCRYGI